ncbi:hypothetical protein [Planctomycetes bacterium K23_9]
MQSREGRLLEVHRVMRDLSPARAEALLRMASESPWVCYDGDARLVQVRKAAIVWEKGPRDYLYLQSLREPGHWYGYKFPINASVDSVSFDGDFLGMDVSGEIAEGIVISTSSPVAIRLPWARGLATPPQVRIKKMLLASWRQKMKSQPASGGSSEAGAE